MFEEGQEIEFNCYGKKVKGKFIKQEDATIFIEVICSDYPFEKSGDIARINKGFLIIN